MKFNITPDFCDLPTDIRSAILKSAENALGERREVFYKQRHFTNYDELVSYLGTEMKAAQPEADWPGERLDN